MRGRCRRAGALGGRRGRWDDDFALLERVLRGEAISALLLPAHVDDRGQDRQLEDQKNHDREDDHRRRVAHDLRRIDRKNLGNWRFSGWAPLCGRRS
jgi:hypothetical protein